MVGRLLEVSVRVQIINLSQHGVNIFRRSRGQCVANVSVLQLRHTGRGIRPRENVVSLPCPHCFMGVKYGCILEYNSMQNGLLYNDRRYGSASSMPMVWQSLFLLHPNRVHPVSFIIILCFIYGQYLIATFLFHILYNWAAMPICYLSGFSALVHMLLEHAFSLHYRCFCLPTCGQQFYLTLSI